MSFDHIYRYSPLYPGILLKRYKRFFADVELVTGETTRGQKHLRERARAALVFLINRWEV